MERDLETLVQAFTRYPNHQFTADTHWLILLKLAAGFLEAAKVHLQGHGMSTQQGGRVPLAYSHMVQVRRQTIRSSFFSFSVSCLYSHDVG